MTLQNSSSTDSDEKLAAILVLLERICETPAPTFAEKMRAELIMNLWQDLGLEPQLDKAGNVRAEVPGGVGPRVVVAAHLDTVFSADTPIRVSASQGRLAAPGIGDNSASLAVLTHYLEQILKAGLERPRPHLMVVATVGEEGLGDLYGMRELIKSIADDADHFIALDGHLGTIVTEAVGSKRFEFRFLAKGGHSWGDYPSPSAVHALGHAIYALTKVSIPQAPRSSLNVGQIGGGTSVNAIAQDAFFNLDLRSLDPKILTDLESQALTQIRRVARSHEVQVDIKRVGDRPAGKSKNTRLIDAAKTALRSVDCIPRTAPSSTDANIAIAAGLSSIAFGVYRGADAHRLSEWLEPASLLTGYEAFVDLLENVSQL